MDDQLRRNQPLFSMSIVGQLTGLTARQIRYYEEHKLVYPARSDGNRRLFSFNDIDRLLEIKDLIDQGINLAGIKEVFKLNEEQSEPEVEVKAVEVEQKQPVKQQPPDLTDEELMKYLKKELMHVGKFGKASLIQGELSRFFH